VCVVVQPVFPFKVVDHKGLDPIGREGGREVVDHKGLDPLGREGGREGLALLLPLSVSVPSLSH